jgi:hypothetical protein
VFGNGLDLPPGTPIPAPGAIVLWGSTLARYVLFANKSSLEERWSIASDASGGSRDPVCAPGSFLPSYFRAVTGFAIDRFDAAARLVTRLMRVTKPPAEETEA